MRGVAARGQAAPAVTAVVAGWSAAGPATLRGMSDPAVLREQARTLRSVARSLREKSAALDDDLRTLQQRYPLPSAKVWDAPHATRFKDEITTAVEDLGQVGRDVDRYADDCDDEATRRDQQADDLEREQAAAGG